jgi:acyl-CoA synthetase (AMP-forming)/AMP-acid ligase II
MRFGYLDASGWQDGFLARPEAAGLSFAAVPFDHPLWVLYSSGSAGLPKAIVHGHGGILLEQVKHRHLHLDAQASGRVFWFATTGWTMWNFLVGVLVTRIRRGMADARSLVRPHRGCGDTDAHVDGTDSVSEARELDAKDWRQVLSTASMAFKTTKR